MHTIQCIIPYIQFIYPGWRRHTRSYVNTMGKFNVVVELERCECGALERSDFFFDEKKSPPAKITTEGEVLHKAPHSHHSSSPTTPNWPLKIAHDLEMHVNPSATHSKLTLTKIYKKCLSSRMHACIPSIGVLDFFFCCPCGTQCISVQLKRKKKGGNNGR